MANQHCGRVSVFSRANREAGALLTQRNNRFLLMQAWILALLLLPLYVLLQNTCALLRQMADTSFGGWYALGVDLLWGVLVAAFTLFVTLPYLLGILHLAGGMVRGESLVLSDVFAPFASGRGYRRALGMSFGVFWRLWLVWMVADSTWYFLMWLLRDASFALAIAVPAVILEVLFGILLCLCSFPMLFLRMQGVGKPTTTEGWRASKAGVRFFLGYLPHLALGILTVGILLLSDALPRMCISYVCYCKQIIDGSIGSEELKNE